MAPRALVIPHSLASYGAGPPSLVRALLEGSARDFLLMEPAMMFAATAVPAAAAVAAGSAPMSLPLPGDAVAPVRGVPGLMVLGCGGEGMATGGEARTAAVISLAAGS